MPRRPSPPKNRMCRNTTLSEDALTLLLWCYVQAGSFEQSREQIALYPTLDAEISDKMIPRYFRKFGTHFAREFLAELCFPVTRVLPDRMTDEEEAAYAEELEQLAIKVIADAKSRLNYDGYRVLLEGGPAARLSGDVPFELQKIRSGKNGHKGLARGDLTLALLRVDFYSMSDPSEAEVIKLSRLHRFLLTKLFEKPMR